MECARDILAKCQSKSLDGIYVFHISEKIKDLLNEVSLFGLLLVELLFCQSSHSSLIV